MAYYSGFSQLRNGVHRFIYSQMHMVTFLAELDSSQLSYIKSFSLQVLVFEHHSILICVSTEKLF